MINNFMLFFLVARCVTINPPCVDISVSQQCFDQLTRTITNTGYEIKQRRLVTNVYTHNLFDWLESDEKTVISYGIDSILKINFASKGSSSPKILFSECFYFSTPSQATEFHDLLRLKRESLGYFKAPSRLLKANCCIMILQADSEYSRNTFNAITEHILSELNKTECVEDLILD